MHCAAPRYNFWLWYLIEIRKCHTQKSTHVFRYSQLLATHTGVLLRKNTRRQPAQHCRKAMLPAVQPGLIEERKVENRKGRKRNSSQRHTRLGRLAWRWLSTGCRVDLSVPEVVGASISCCRPRLCLVQKRKPRMHAVVLAAVCTKFGSCLRCMIVSASGRGWFFYGKKSTSFVVTRFAGALRYARCWEAGADRRLRADVRGLIHWQVTWLLWLSDEIQQVMTAIWRIGSGHGWVWAIGVRAHVSNI